MTIRVRFAPSPTGNLHIGGARTALFNWLYARANGGQFLLRIEDTDLERSTIESRESILDALRWLRLDWDGEIVLQSQRRDAHVAIAERLLDEGKAYKCFCTPDELAAMREQAVAEGRTRTYDRTWRDRTDHPAGMPYVVRVKMPVDGATTLHDAIVGDITVENDHLDDFVILRSDGSPTYNFVVVCDDANMGITDVIRGQDHVSNTFRQINLYRALGEPLPRFAHLPLIDGLSKRKGSVSVQYYRDLGYPYEAVNNYIARLGWSHGDTELISMNELAAIFTLADVNNSNSRYDEDKFAWVASQWMKRLPARDVAERVVPFLAAIGIEADVDDRLVALVEALQPRSDTLVAMADQARFAFEAPTTYDDKAVAKWIKADTRAAYLDLLDALTALPAFTSEAVDACLATILERHDTKMGKLAQPVRIALTGTAVSPPIDVTLAAVGKDEAILRLRAAVSLFPEA